MFLKIVRKNENDSVSNGGYSCMKKTVADVLQINLY